MKWRNPSCDSEACPGYVVNGESLAVERCDTCKIFPSDDAAAAAVEALAHLGLETLVARSKRELETAAKLAPLLVALTHDGPAPSHENSCGGLET